MNRSALTLIALAVALLATGCGSNKTSGNATDDALSFVPKQAPIVVSINTDPNGGQWKNVDKLLSKFPGSGAIKAQLKQSISSSSGGKLDYDRDVKPILGNDLVVSAPSTAAARVNQYAVAVKPRDLGKAQQLVGRYPKVGTLDGQDLHREPDGSSYEVLDDGVLVSAPSRAQLDAALKAHDGDHMTSDDFDKLAAGVGGDALVRIGVNAQALIASSPRSAAARRVKWVAALRNYGETISAQDDGLTSNFKLTTEGDLSPSDLPLATGAQSPAVVRRAGELGFGIRDIAQSWHFAESVARVTDPSGYAKYAKEKARASKMLGVNLDRDVIGQFNGDATVSVSLDGKVAFRSAVRDPKALKATLTKAGPRLNKLATDGSKVAAPKGGSGLYTVTQPSGKKAVFGVVGNNFVAASDAARAAEIAGESPSKVSGAKGAGVMATDARSLVNQQLQKRGQGAAALITGALGDFVMSVESETSGLSGSFKLNVK